MKIQKKNIFYFFLGGGGGGQVGGESGYQDGCERRIEVFVKIEKKKLRGEGGSGWGGGGSGWVLYEELKFL